MLRRGATTAAHNLRRPSLSILQVTIRVYGVRVDPALRLVGIANVTIGNERKIGAADRPQLGQWFSQSVSRAAVHAQGLHPQR